MLHVHVQACMYCRQQYPLHCNRTKLSFTALIELFHMVLLHMHFIHVNMQHIYDIMLLICIFSLSFLDDKILQYGYMYLFYDSTSTRSFV